MSLIGMGSLRDFTGGSYTVPENPVLRGAGIGDFVDGKYALPQNPVLDGLGSLVPSAPLYSIPQNSVLAYYGQGGASYSGGLSGLGCGGKKDDCGCGCSGMGQLSLTSITAPFTTAFADIQTAISSGSFSVLTMEDWMVIAGTGLAAVWLFGKKGR